MQLGPPLVVDNAVSIFAVTMAMFAVVVMLMALAAAQAYDPEARAREIVGNMTLDEKIAMLHGYPGTWREKAG